MVQIIILVPFLQTSSTSQVNAETQKQIEIQRLQQEHLKRQQELILQQQHNIQELHNQISSQYAAGKGINLPGPQSLMFLPFLEQLRSMPPTSLPQMTPGKATNALQSHVSTLLPRSM